MASSSSDFSTEREAALRRQQQKKGAPIKFLVPLIYAPVLPLIRIALRHNPVVRDRLFYGVLAGAFAHGASISTLVGTKFGITIELAAKSGGLGCSFVRFQSFSVWLHQEGHIENCA